MCELYDSESKNTERFGQEPSSAFIFNRIHSFSLINSLIHLYPTVSIIILFLPHHMIL